MKNGILTSGVSCTGRICIMGVKMMLAKISSTKILFCVEDCGKEDLSVAFH
jgi:hypothetical protein